MESAGRLTPPVGTSVVGVWPHVLGSFIAPHTALANRQLISFQDVPGRSRRQAQVHHPGRRPPLGRGLSKAIWLIDEHPTAFHNDRIGFHGKHAGRRYDLARAHIELAAMKIALDDIVAQIAFCERTGPVGARVIGDEELPVDIEDGEHQASDLHLQGATLFDINRTAELEPTWLRGHGASG
jgi:hypothetical protein